MSARRHTQDSRQAFRRAPAALEPAKQAQRPRTQHSRTPVQLERSPSRPSRHSARLAREQERFPNRLGALAGSGSRVGRRHSGRRALRGRRTSRPSATSRLQLQRLTHHFVQVSFHGGVHTRSKRLEARPTEVGGRRTRSRASRGHHCRFTRRTSRQPQEPIQHLREQVGVKVSSGGRGVPPRGSRPSARGRDRPRQRIRSSRSLGLHLRRRFHPRRLRWGLHPRGRAPREREPRPRRGLFSRVFPRGFHRRRRRRRDQRRARGRVGRPRSRRHDSRRGSHVDRG